VPTGRRKGWDIGAPGWRLRRLPPSGEEGFTLIELVIVLVILPIVVGGIAVVMITSLHDQAGLQTKLADSSDSVVASAYYSRDIQSAAQVTIHPSPSSPAACTPAGLPGATHVMSLEWGTGPTVVSYYYWTPAAPVGAATELVRLSCQANGPSTRVVMSHGLSTPPPGSSVVTVSCVGGAACSTFAGAGGWIPSFDLTDVSIGITQSTGYQFTLVGSPLTGPQIKSSLPVAGSLLLLGPETDLTYWLGGVLGLPGDNVTVNGTVDLNSGPSGTAPAILFNSQNDSLVAKNGGSVDVLNCAGAGAANGAPCPNGTWANCNFFGLCKGNGVTPSPTSITPAVPDPLAAWAQVNQPTPLTGGGSASCNKQGTNWSCPAGRYTTGLAVPAGVQVTFTGGGNGKYQFGAPGCTNCALTFGGGDTATFSSGVYRFDGGLNVDGSNSPNNLSSMSGGVLFYVAGGPTDFASNGSANKIQLAAMSSGPYAGLLFWQDGSDPNNKVSIAGSQSPNLYSGEIYAPNDELDLVGFGNNVTTGPVCANSMVISGAQANIDIG
jgi:prepilin-type N-terminal cleavage/methylation domain-containing protein